jgi:xanthine dehydrogenase YagT iron-sulfur-binding subunit
MNEQVIKLIVNGEPIEVSVGPWVTLLEVIRDKLELTGTKEACSLGECGACTLILD